MEEIKYNKLLASKESIASKYIEEKVYPFEVLPEIKDIILEIIENLDPNEYTINNNIAIAKDALIHHTAIIIGPAIIGSKTVVRVNAFIRENVIIGSNCTVGNSCEIKNSILFNNCQVPHFNYVGDSILGFKAHLGAGVVISNLKADQSNVKIKNNNKCLETKLKKFGALVGDFSEVGCNSVLNPGTVLGQNVTIYPVNSIRGYVPESHIYKNCQEIVPKE